MATKTYIVSDMSNAEGAQTITFSLNDQHYEIDLTNDEITTFKNTIADYTNRARPIQARTIPTTTDDPTNDPTDPRALSVDERGLIRRWAQETKRPVGTYGIIPQSVMDDWIDYKTHIGATRFNDMIRTFGEWHRAKNALSRTYRRTNRANELANIDFDSALTIDFDTGTAELTFDDRFRGTEDTILAAREQQARTQGRGRGWSHGRRTT